MKVIKAGNPTKGWWVGLRVASDKCGQEVELEQEDFMHVNVAISSGFVLVICQCCKTETRRNRPAERDDQ